MAGTLFVVATPIGNLEDITLRALRVLREANLIAAEDTRRTAKLLSHYGIHTPTLSFHAHNSRARLPQLIARVRAGESVALVTDAGTPGISDPGAELVAACRREGVVVDPIPGASAALVAAVGSGFPLNSVTFLGFPPLKAKARKQWIHGAAALPGTVVFFEAPHRIGSTIGDLRVILGNRQICLGRELTKVHQEFVCGAATSDVFLSITQKGEFTVVIGPVQESAVAASASDAEIAEAFRALSESGSASGRREAASEVGRRLGLTANEVYRALERSKL
ncbi:MAG TPA: 16S rRNA (cytidine(1402)-2'-O)-methyltransferase [Vicinamibacterales bacterium]|nr:16S rRNA (cytidine(1402)-2'-O)-methyltransferase [Vicinamibacterales bacterium]